jgi:hypothetical protein
VFRRSREVAWLALPAIGKDGALVQFAAVAAAARLATLSPQGVERARQKRFTSEADFEQAGEKLLRMEQLGAERAKTLVHGVTLGICRSLYIVPYRVSQSFAGIGKKVKKVENLGNQKGRGQLSRVIAQEESVARRPGKGGTAAATALARAARPGGGRQLYV